MFRIVICDDEKERTIPIYKTLAAVIKNNFIDDTELFTVRPEKLADYTVDERYTYLFFLDVSYRNISGIDIALKLRAQYKDIYIVFATMQPDFVYMTVNQNTMPSGFLTKPPAETELKRIFLTIYDYYKNNKKISDNVLTIAVGSSVYKFFHDEIYYIEALNKKIYIYTKVRRVSCYSSLSYFQRELGESFVRCHKSYIVSKDKIKNVYLSEMTIEMADGSKVPLSRTYKSAIKDLFNGGDRQNVT